MKVAITDTDPIQTELRQRKINDFNGDSSNSFMELEVSSSEEDEPVSASPTSSVASCNKKAFPLGEKPVVASQDKSALAKLFTSKEEVHILHAHKILGFTALVSFLYRLANIGVNDGNFGPNIGTLIFIAHHLLLNVSSFVFRIPQRRIRDGGFRIWPEYRIHSLVFASRSLAYMLLMWYEHTVHAFQPYHLMDLVIVLLAMVGADYGSYLQGENRSSTVRGTSYSDPYGTWWASEMQFALTAACLIGLRRYSVHLGAVMIIQCNSFLMTLRRKNVASHEVLTSCYGALLLAGLLIAVIDDDYNDCMLPAGTYGNIAVLLRMGPLHLDKYLLWTILFASVCAIRHVTQSDLVNNRFWVYAFIVTKACAAALGLRKRSEKMKNQTEINGSPRMVQAVMASHVMLFLYIYYLNFVLEWDEDE